MKQLQFENDVKRYERLSNGRFATKEMAYADKQNVENKRLRIEVEKYKRMYLVVAKENSDLKRKMLKNV